MDFEHIDWIGRGAKLAADCSLGYNRPSVRLMDNRAGPTRSDEPISRLVWIFLAVSRLRPDKALAIAWWW
jgi:hypothetical protein